VQGIYEIRNIISGRVYVGSSNDITYRFRKHRERLNGGYHSSLRFQASWDKHGPGAFTFTILEVVEQRSDLHVREQHWIDALDATNPDYGLNVRGTGRRHTRLCPYATSGRKNPGCWHWTETHSRGQGQDERSTQSRTKEDTFRSSQGSYPHRLETLGRNTGEPSQD